MTDWTKSMQQRFRYYEVDPSTWRDVREIEGVTQCEVTRDIDSDTVESASLTIVGGTLSECVVRAYMECRQGGAWERHGIGTWICQTPKRTWRRGVGELQVSAYSPLLAVADDLPPMFYTVRKGADPAQWAVTALSNGIVDAIPATSDYELDENHSCDPGDSWLDLARDMAEKCSMKVNVGPDGRPFLEADKDPSSLSVSWVYEDGSNSILLGGIDDECDWFKLPNVVEVVATSDEHTYVSEAVNDDPLSAISTASRGRRVVERITDPELAQITQSAVDRAARKALAEKGGAERRLSYEHGYCPVRLGDCVRIRSQRHGIDARARVVKQTITLSTGCTVKEEAVCEMAMGASL